MDSLELTRLQRYSSRRSSRQRLRLSLVASPTSSLFAEGAVLLPSRPACNLCRNLYSSTYALSCELRPIDH